MTNNKNGETMKKGKAGIFTLSTSSIIVIECLISIILIFLDTFLVSKLMQIDPANGYTNVAIFNFVYYMMIALAMLVGNAILVKVNKGAFMSIGAFLLAGMFIVIYFLGDNIANWIWLLAVGVGLTYGIFYAGFAALMVEAVSSKNQTIYFSVKNILIFLTKTIFPLILGSIIMKSFPAMCVILAVVCILIFVFSFFVKYNKSKRRSYNLMRFWKIVNDGGEETKPLKTLYLSGFFRGMCFDLIATVLTILIFLQSEGNDFTIGLVQTIFTGAQLVSMFIFMKTYHKNLSQWFIFVSLGFIIAGAIPVFIKPCLITVLIFYGIYYFFRLFITTITDMRKTSVIRILSMHDHCLEHNTTYQIIYGPTRAISYLLLCLCLVIPNQELMLDIVLGLNLVGYIGYSISLFFLEKQLIAQDIKWKREHPDKDMLLAKLEDNKPLTVIDTTNETPSIEKEILKNKL